MNKFLKGPWLYLIALVVIVIFAQAVFLPMNVPDTEVSYSEFLRMVRDGEISRLMVTSYEAYGLRRESTIAADQFPDRYDFSLQIPNSIDVFESDIRAVVAEKLGKDPEQITAADYSFEYSIQPVAEDPWWYAWVPMLVLTLVIVVFWYVFMRQQMGGSNRMMSFGKSKARVVDEKNRVTFAQVAGADEEKEELREIVEFLKNPKRFLDLGARIPKGVLLVGPPGTGKTLLAKAVAGEAGVPFYSISDFVEMFVGVGASRVRDLFETAKKNSPAIVFIDEIDAVGRQRGAGLGGGHDEREQTLNQLLVEMDGFTANEGVIVIAATNRPDILDRALLRPGRFDRQVTVNYPDVKGREAILRVHSKGKPLDSSVSLDVLARRTPYMTGADLENVMNESAILAARKHAKAITMEDVEEAITRVQVGPEKKSRVITELDKKLVSYHESGHALLAYLLPNCDPVHEISIIPRGQAGGYTMTMPNEEKNFISGARIRDEIVELLGGHTAEKLMMGDVSTGSTSDLHRASDMARRMVTEYGMSEEIGPVYLGGDQEVFIGRDFGHAKNYSEQLAAQIDKAVHSIVTEAQKRAEELLTAHKDVLELLAAALFQREKLDQEEFNAIVEGRSLPEKAEPPKVEPPKAEPAEPETQTPETQTPETQTPEAPSEGEKQS